MIRAGIWIGWLHLLGGAVWVGGNAVLLWALLSDAGDEARPGAAARRAHALTSRAMELVVVTGIVNVFLRGMASGMVFSRGFVGMLTLKVLLVLVMAGVQVWMGMLWKRQAGSIQPGGKRARAALALQVVLGAVVLLLGLGVRSV